MIVCCGRWSGTKGSRFDNRWRGVEGLCNGEMWDRDSRNRTEGLYCQTGNGRQKDKSAMSHCISHYTLHWYRKVARPRRLTLNSRMTVLSLFDSLPFTSTCRRLPECLVAREYAGRFSS
jgi:hypothetical protein